MPQAGWMEATGLLAIGHRQPLIGMTSHDSAHASAAPPVLQAVCTCLQVCITLDRLLAKEINDAR